METRRIFSLMSLPALWMLLLFLLPMSAMAIFSIRAGTFGAQREIFTLDNYREFLANSSFQGLLLRSAVIAFETSLFTVLLAYPLAYFLAFRAGPRAPILLMVIIAPAWTSYLLRILAWKLILGSGGLLNTLLISVGLVHEALPILLYSPTAIVVTLVYVWIPFVSTPIFAALQRIDRRLLEAAADLGCAPWESFLRITLPLSLPGVATGFFFVFIPTLGEYVTPLLVGGANGVMYGNIIQDQFVRALNWPMGSVMSLVMLGVVLLLIVILSRMVNLTEVSGL